MRPKIIVDVFVHTPGEFENTKDKPFIRRAIEEGKVVFESGRLHK